VWVSKDRVSWSKVWNAEKVQSIWAVIVNGTVGGNSVIGVNARYVKIGLQEANYLHLKAVKIYGEQEPGQFTVHVRTTKEGLLRIGLSGNWVRVNLPISTRVRLDALDAKGRRFEIAASSLQPAGIFQANWRKAITKPGLYWVRLWTGERIVAQKSLNVM
jgi:hypothetical protein